MTTKHVGKLLIQLNIAIHLIMLFLLRSRFVSRIEQAYYARLWSLSWLCYRFIYTMFIHVVGGEQWL